MESIAFSSSLLASITYILGFATSFCGDFACSTKLNQTPTGRQFPVGATLGYPPGVAGVRRRRHEIWGHKERPSGAVIAEECG